MAIADYLAYKQSIQKHATPDPEQLCKGPTVAKIVPFPSHSFGCIRYLVGITPDEYHRVITFPNSGEKA